MQGENCIYEVFAHNGTVFVFSIFAKMRVIGIILNNRTKDPISQNSKTWQHCFIL